MAVCLLSALVGTPLHLYRQRKQRMQSRYKQAVYMLQSGNMIMVSYATMRNQSQHVI